MTRVGTGWLERMQKNILTVLLRLPFIFDFFFKKFMCSNYFCFGGGGRADVSVRGWLGVWVCGRRSMCGSVRGTVRVEARGTVRCAVVCLGGGGRRRRVVRASAVLFV